MHRQRKIVIFPKYPAKIILDDIIAFSITNSSKDNCQNLITFNSHIERQTYVKNRSASNSYKSMSDEFQQGFEGYAIATFINSDPNNSLTADCIGNARTFATHIYYINQHSDISEKNGLVYQNIINFTNILWEYIGLLKKTSKDSQNFPENYKPFNGNNNNFVRDVNNYRQKLNVLSAHIHEEIKNNNNECLHEDISKYYKQDIYSHKLIE